MSEFRRFISYIYSYKGSAKLHNTGFAKMEARGEVLRVQVHIKGAYAGNNQLCKVYGFFREEGFIKGILLGQFFIKNGMGDMAAVTDRNGVGNTDKSLEDLGGIYISIGEGKDVAMASEWDNIAVDTAYFKPYEKRVMPKNVEKEMAGEQTAEEIQGSNTRAAKIERTGETKNVGVSEQQWIQGSGMSKELQPASKQVSATEEHLTEATVSETEKILEKPWENKKQIEEEEPLESKGVSEENPLKNNEIFARNEKLESNQEVVEKKEAEENATIDSVLREQAVLCGEINLNVENFTKNQEECEQKHSWKEFLREYTIVHPFENCDNVEVIRIEPKDLSRLSKEYWVLATNSFLLHGYCSYRYLILCKNKQEEKYFLGVPGVFHPREKVIAGMFGFNEFYMSRKGKLRHGEFGYYVRPVQL